jgi:hypothetical protein
LFSSVAFAFNIRTNVKFILYGSLFLFLGSAYYCVYFKMFLHIYLLPLHVLAFVGHPQAEYTIISGSYRTYNRSIVLCALVLLGSIYNIFSKFCRLLNVSVGVV